MIRKLLILAGAVALSACSIGDVSSAGTVPGSGTSTPSPISPGTIANHSTADEQALLRAEQAYKLSRTLGELAVDTGLAKGGTLVRLQSLDNQLYGGLTTARAAYQAFNSPSLLSAVDRVAELAEQVRALAGGAK